MRAVALTIAGSDPCGGAGLQTDLQTFAVHGVHGAAVATTLTIQNTQGVRDRMDVPAAIVIAQLDAVMDDLTVAAAKTGLLPTVDVIEAVAARLRAHVLPALVVDPVLVATSGDVLADRGTAGALAARLFPIASLVTPNMTEAATLVGSPVRTRADMHAAARHLLASGAQAVLVTGGDLDGDAVDVLHARGSAPRELIAPRIAVGPVHGTGCTLAAAIVARLATGSGLPDAVAEAKTYVHRAIAAAEPLGHGSLLLGHHPAAAVARRPDG